jgi:hypothetical protein
MGNSHESRISVSEPQPAVIALYVRDAAGLRAGEGIPPLFPPVTVGESVASIDLGKASAEWEEWWGDIMRLEDQHKPGEAPPPMDEVFPVPARFPALAELASRVQPDALEYSAARKREAAATRGEQGPSQVLFKILREARPSPWKGRRAREFSLHVTQLPVEGEFRQTRSEHHLVVGMDTYKTPEAYEAALRQALGWR